MTPLQPAQTYLDGIDREWERVGAPGTWLTGPERIAVATVAREALHGVPGGGHGLTEVAATAARTIAAEPA
ncbi:MAG: hypothetical protein GY929_13495, partial [Actinomycetia bacterium]|nr:hypothetical protein [Actinomycetes bacterium]